MKCNNCGAENAPNSKFCEACGSKLEEVAKVQPPMEQPMYQQPQYPVPTVKKKSKAPLIIGIVVGVFLLISALIVTGIWFIFFRNTDKVENEVADVVVSAEDVLDELESDPTEEPTPTPTPEPNVDDYGMSFAETYQSLDGEATEGIEPEVVVPDVSTNIPTTQSYDSSTRILRVNYEEFDNYEIYMEMPVFQETTTGYAVINQYYEDSIVSVYDEDFAQESAEMAEYAQSVSDTYIQTRIATINDETSTYVGVTLSYFLYTGGTMNTATYGQTFDVNTGEMLTLTEIYSNYSESEISEFLYYGTMEAEGENGVDLGTWWSIVETYDLNSLSFSVVDGYVNVYFSKYEIAAGAYGDITIVIPLEVMY